LIASTIALATGQVLVPSFIDRQKSIHRLFNPEKYYLLSLIAEIDSSSSLLYEKNTTVHFK
jgi:hypothetical protein